MTLMSVLQAVVKNKVIFKEPPAKKAPPMWIRSILILTCTSVSFSHGSNDGQKGCRSYYDHSHCDCTRKVCLDHTKDPVKLQTNISTMQTMMAGLDSTN